MADSKIDEKSKSTPFKVTSYNEFLRHFYPDDEKSRKYADEPEATRLMANAKMLR